jgi:hypothetical protein
MKEQAVTDIVVREDYRYIQVWGQICGYTEKEISDIIELAREEHAPHDALFKRASSGVWATFRTHCTRGYTISNEFERVFAKNGWGKPEWGTVPTWRSAA